MKVIYKKDILRPVRIIPPAEGEVWELITVTEVFEGETVELEGLVYGVGSVAIGEYYGARIYKMKLLRAAASGADPAAES